jgi:hypothetical protein
MEEGEEQRLSFNLCQEILTKGLGMRHINKVCPMAADSGAEGVPHVWICLIMKKQTNFL